MPAVVERMRKEVKAFRSGSKRKSTLAIADFPERYNVEVIPNRPFLCIPKVSSEKREYVPIGWLTPYHPGDLVFSVDGRQPLAKRHSYIAGAYELAPIHRRPAKE